MGEGPAVAVLFDADNVPSRCAREVLDLAASEGRVVVKRAYGNWAKPSLRSWLLLLGELAIRPCQQTDYVSGKNASDIALMIDAMDLLYQKRFDTFVIVSSDSDFTPLAMRLRESGVRVVGAGSSAAKGALRNACDRFIVLENLASSESAPDFGRLHERLRRAWELHQNKSGLCDIRLAAECIRQIDPGFTVRSCGARSFSKLLKKFPDLYRVEPQKGTVFYRCLEEVFEDPRDNSVKEHFKFSFGPLCWEKPESAGFSPGFLGFFSDARA